MLIDYFFHVLKGIKFYYKIKKFNKTQLKYKSNYMHPESISMGLMSYIGSYSSYKKQLQSNEILYKKIQELKKGSQYATHSR